jgi:predicted HTH domain antitoxin
MEGEADRPHLGGPAMPLILSDEELQAAGLTPETARIELACRLFEAGKLDLFHARKLSGRVRVDFEDELIARKIPVYYVTEETWAQDLAAMPSLLTEPRRS